MFCHSCNLEIQHDSENCPICGGLLSELVPQHKDDVITIISDYYSTETQASEPSGESQYKSQPTAFVSFGQLDTANERSDKPPERRFRFRFVLIPAIIVVIVTLAVAWAIDFMTPTLEASASALLDDIRTRTEASVLVLAKPLFACFENGWISADIAYTDELDDTFSGTVTLASSAETDMHHLSVNAEIYGNPVDASLFVGRDHAALGSSLLGDSCYGVRFASLEQDLDKFTSAAGLTDIFSRDFTQLVNMIDFIFNSGGVLTLPESTIMELDSILTGFIKGMTSYTDRERRTIINDERVTKVTYTYSTTVADVAVLGRELLDIARRDESLRGLITVYMQYHSIYKYGTLATEPAENYLDTLENTLRYLEENCSGEINAWFTSINGRLNAISVQTNGLMVEGSPQSFGAHLDFGQNVNDDWTLDCNFSTPQEYRDYRAIWEFDGFISIPENKITITVGDGYISNTYELRSTRNSDTGAFTLSVQSSLESTVFNLSGTLLVYGADSFTLALDTAPELTLQLDGRGGGNHVALPEFVNLDRWDDGTLELFSSAVSELYASIYSYQLIEVPYDKTTDTIFITR